MQRQQKIAELFATVLEKAPNAQATFLRKECGADFELQTEIEKLLEAFHHAHAAEFLSVPALDIEAEYFADDEDEQEKLVSRVGETFGHYKILGKIGAGGMGAVYLAARTDDYEQRVAVKIIKRGMDTDAILRRFRTERQILAQLEHPFIARLLEGGTTDDGLPYLVMEYVEGVSVGEYCKNNNLTERDVLGLFRKICAAVSFAHQNLIVHRDLKPSNILVTEDGTPKLLDFGIAKLLNSSGESATQTRQQILTPAYASPEQTRGEMVGTTSDVYSLGKVLAEMLEVESAQFQNSKSKSRKNENRKILDGKLAAETASKIENRKLSRDLQNILAMALREDAVRRYASVEAFSEDVRRHLADLPVSARRDSVTYRATKFIRRNRIAVAVASLFVLSLIGGLLATLWQARKAERERELAEQERVLAERRFDSLRKLSNSFVTEIHGAIEFLPGSLAARQLLIKRATEQLDALALESGNNAALEDELGEAYYNLAQMPGELTAREAETCRKSIALYQNLLAQDPNNVRYRKQVAKGYALLGDSYKMRGDVAQTLDYDRQAISMLESIAGDEPNDSGQAADLADAYHDLAVTLNLMGRANEALGAGRRSLVFAEKLRQTNPDRLDYFQMFVAAHSDVAISLAYLGNYRQAILEFQQSATECEQMRAAHPEDTRFPRDLWAINRRLAVVLEAEGEYDAAIKHGEISLSFIRYLLAESPKDVGNQRNAAFTETSFGQILARSGRAEKALPHFENALNLSEQVLAFDPERTESKIDLAREHGNLGNALILTGKTDEGLRHLHESIRLYDEMNAFDAPNANLRRDFAEVCDFTGAALGHRNIRASREFYERSLAIWSAMKQAGILSRADAAQPEAIARRLQSLK